MLERIEEIKKALKNDMPESAMALTLTLPDICGRVEEKCPEEERSKNVGKRYINWIKKHIPDNSFNVNPEEALSDFRNSAGLNLPKFPTLTPEAIYQLRCHFLHSGDVAIESEKCVEDMDHFVLRKIGSGDFTDEDGIGVSSGFSCYVEIDENGKKIKHYEIDVGYFCGVIIEAVEKFYNDCEEKDAFVDHKVEFV